MIDIDTLCSSVNELSIQHSTLECFLHTIQMSDYIQSCKSKTSKDPTSISSLIDRPLSQSDCIKIGIAIEDLLRRFITNNIDGIKDIKERNTKSRKEKDHIFINETDKVIHYAEVKANLNLDTEKYKATINKCIEINHELTTQYPDYTIKMYLVGARYLNSSEMSDAIRKKYSSIRGNLVGINEYIQSLGHTRELLEPDGYRVLLNEMVKAMFDK